MTPFFSIIIPVFNADLFLEQCLNSVLEQSFKSWELICVDDGSTDKSARILADFAEKNEKIKIKSINNSGTAVARNEGITLAAGEYILFIDSDDWVSPDALKVIHDALLGKELDILSFNGFIYNHSDGKTAGFPIGMRPLFR